MAGTRSGRGIFVPALLILAVDTLILILSTVGAIELRQSTPGFRTEGRDVEALVYPIAMALVPAWIILLSLTGTYQRRWLGSGPEEFKRVLNVGLLIAAGLGVTAYLFQYPLSRGFFAFFFVIAIPLLLVGRWVMRRVLHSMLRAGKYNTKVLIAGDDNHIDDILPALARNRWLGYQPIGLLMRMPPDDGEMHGLPVLGRPGDAVKAIAASEANAVIFTEGSFTRAHDFNRLAVQLENVAAQTIVVPALSDISAGRMTVRPVAGMPLVHVERPTAARASRWGKRLFDLVGSTAAIIISSPIMLAVAIAIKLDDGGPVLFKQERVGIKGQPFDCLKFRSMVTNAEELKAELMESNESDGALFKMAKDPRITKVGHFIRKYSLDEFPQFFNVLKGDMSLVGPRPALPSEVETYKSHVLRRLDVRPGITGLWQVSGRSDLPWDETVRLDLYYVDNWSLLQDITILFRTVKVILTGSGAY